MERVIRQRLLSLQGRVRHHDASPSRSASRTHRLGLCRSLFGLDLLSTQVQISQLILWAPAVIACGQFWVFPVHRLWMVLSQLTASEARDHTIISGLIPTLPPPLS